MFYTHGALYLLMLISVLPELILEKDIYLLMGYWAQFIIDSAPNKCGSGVLSELGIFLNYCLFLVLIILMKSSIFGICCSVLIAVLHFSLNTTDKINKKHSVNEEKLSENQPWKNILKSLYPGIMFLVKVKPHHNKMNDLNVDEKNNLLTQETRNQEYMEKFFDLILVNDQCTDGNLLLLRDCFEFALKNFEVIKLVKKEQMGSHISSNYIPVVQDFDLEETGNDRKKLLSQKDLGKDQNISMAVFNFLKTCLIRANENKDRKISCSLKDETISNYGKTVCHGKIKDHGQANYVLTMTEFMDKSFDQSDGHYVLFEFVEKAEEGVNSKEVYNFKDQMLANVAHDLRSPINGILSFIDLSIDAKEEKERLKNLEYAKISGNLLLNLVSDILDFSVIRDGKLNIQVKPFPLKEWLNEVVNLMTLQAEMKQLQIQVENDLDPFFVLQSDRRRLSQLVINLLGNSIKFTNKGIIKLKISKTNFRNVVKFEIKDTGIGIKPEILPQLFKPFATFDTEKGLNKYGIGLGLNICKMIVGLLGPCDSMFVSSIYHKGTKFGFLLFTNIKEKTISSKKSQNESNRANVIFNEYNSFGILKNPLNKRIIRTSTSYPKKIDFKKILGIKKLSKRRTRSDFYLDFKENKNEKHDTLLFRKFKSDEVKDNFPLDERLNPFDYFSNYNHDSTSTFIGDEIKEFSGLPNLRKRTHSSEIPSLRNMKLTSYNSSYSEIEDEFNSNESPLKLISMKQQQLTRNKFMKTNNNIRLTEKHKIFKKKMVSTQEISLNLTEKEHDKKNRINLLLVDDNPFNLLILSEYLKKLKGYALTSTNAYNGAMALEMFQSQNPPSAKFPIDLILMDCQMPILDGYDTSKAIRNLIEQENYQPVSIIAITAFQDEKKCLEAGMNSYLMKPVNEKDFLDAMRMWINS